jgi:hypothetical protein
MFRMLLKGGQKFRPSDKNGGMKSHDHEVQWVPKAAAIITSTCGQYVRMIVSINHT